MEDKLNLQQIKNIIAANIKKFNFSIAELAELAQISRADVYRIVSARTLPDMEVLRRLCKNLGITVNDLIRVDKSNIVSSDK
ncbi:MAG: helix-turn-helix transcriptional regulator [Clostridia bacterium]|nr:helix-turn-helix transcriptional regulator [Clostridia bacterium]